MWEGLAAQLEGSRVVLEPLGPQHADGLFAAGADPEVWRWMPLNATSSRAVFDAWLADALERTRAGLDVAFATLDRGSGRPIGSTRYLALRPEHRGLEIGWTWLESAAWRSGANAEAKLLMLEHAFVRHACMRVEFKTDAKNERSRRALEALPARFEGVFRKHMLVRGGELRDSAYYSILDDEWPEVRANLERRLTG